MLKILVIPLVAVLCVHGCEKVSFKDVKIVASKFFHTKKDPDDIQLGDTFTGCITATDQLKGALQIEVKNQKVPVLYEGAVQGLEWLHDLVLEENAIEDVQQGAFQDLPTLSKLSLSHNQLTKISEGIFNNLTVKRLFLNHNSISTIAPTAFDNMPNMVRIDLSHNNLAEWNSNWFTNTPNIYHLSASDNLISALPEHAFKNINGRHVFANGETIITSIYLTRNRIAEIHPTAFSNLKQLDFLHLDHNNIVNFDAKVFSEFDSIRHLWLDGNKIVCLGRDVLASLPTCEVIALDGNPFECTCLNKIKEWARKQQGNVRFGGRAIECMQERIRNTLDSVKNIN